MIGHAGTSRLKRKFWYHPLLWLALGMVVILVVIIISKMSMQATANSSQNIPPRSALLAVITNSGSTNAPLSTLTLNADGSGSLVYQKDTCNMCTLGNSNRFVNKTFRAGTFNVVQLKNLLAQIGDVSAIPGHDCLKSISFGSTTTITYLGKKSGDVSCLSNADQKIYLAVKEQVETLYTQALKH